MWVFLEMALQRYKFLHIKKIIAFIAFILPFSALAFGPCTDSVPEGVSYLSSIAACGGNAAVVIYGQYFSAFSAVTRNCNNNDRDPCNKGSTSCAPNYSSPSKAQKFFNTVIESKGHQKNARIFCPKEAGSSEVHKLVRRSIIKRIDPMRSLQMF
jgi:hypothetical protein